MTQLSGQRSEDGAFSSKLLEFITYLRDHPQAHRVVALAQHFGVHRQSIYRYRDGAADIHGVWIDDSGHPDVPKGCLRYGGDNPDLLNITLTRPELDALSTAAARLEPLTTLARQALDKLAEAKRLESRSETPILITPLADQYQPDNLFERVARAIRERRVAKITYRNARDETKTYRFNSYVLIPSDLHLHLVGVSHNSLAAGYDTVISLRLDQVESFTLLSRSDTFPDPDFDAQAYATREFGAFKAEGEPVTVRVCFSAEKARYVERTRRHETQNVTKQGDGSVIWHIEAPLTEDLVYWITSYGPHAEVLEPPDLKEQVLEWAKGSFDANS